MITKRFDIDGEPYDYSALESLAEFKQLTSEARFIRAVDTTDHKRQTVLWGTELLRAIAAKVIPPQEGEMVCFALDFDTAAMEHLIAAVQVTKGFDETPDTV